VEGRVGSAGEAPWPGRVEPLWSRRNRGCKESIDDHCCGRAFA
jgi:hypothetical protein